MRKEVTIVLLLLLSPVSKVIAQDSSIHSFKTKIYNQATNLIVWPDEFNPSKSRWYVHNEIEINAPKEVVWKILVDAKKWHEYYTGAQSPVEFLDTTATSLAMGLVFKFHTMGLKLQPVIKESIENERLAWEVGRPGLTGYHAWVIIQTPNGCRLITAESQNGFLTILQRLFQPNKLLELHDTWLRQIKSRAEKQSPK